MAKKYREVRRILRKAGWEHIRTRGSHEVWAHGDGRTVVVAGKGSRDVPVGTLDSLRSATGLEELR